VLPKECIHSGMQRYRELPGTFKYINTKLSEYGLWHLPKMPYGKSSPAVVSWCYRTSRSRWTILV